MTDRLSWLLDPGNSGPRGRHGVKKTFLLLLRFFRLSCELGHSITSLPAPDRKLGGQGLPQGQTLPRHAPGQALWRRRPRAEMCLSALFSWSLSLLAPFMMKFIIMVETLLHMYLVFCNVHTHRPRWETKNCIWKIWRCVIPFAVRPDSSPEHVS